MAWNRVSPRLSHTSTWNTCLKFTKTGKWYSVAKVDFKKCINLDSHSFTVTTLVWCNYLFDIRNILCSLYSDLLPLFSFNSIYIFVKMHFKKLHTRIHSSSNTCLLSFILFHPTLPSLLFCPCLLHPTPTGPLYRRPSPPSPGPNTLKLPPRAVDSRTHKTDVFLGGWGAGLCEGWKKRSCNKNPSDLSWL